MSLKIMLICAFVVILSIISNTAEAQNPIGIVHVNGTLYCSRNGRPTINPTPVFPNAIVQVACTADVVANAPVNTTTTSNGAYLVVLIPRPNTTANAITSNCRIFVLTPLSTCNAALPSVGLVSNLQFVRTVSGFLPLTYMVASGFTLQT